MSESKVSGVRWSVFLPPFLALFMSVILSFTHREIFLARVTAINTWILQHFDWLYAGGTLFLVILMVVIFFSDLAKLKIGGANAVPLFTPWAWCTVTLCTTIATGLLFWASAEPIFHLTAPPLLDGLQANSPEAQRFALSTLFLHWSFTPYAIYSVPALAFALAFHNHRLPFSFVSLLFPFFRRAPPVRLGTFIDVVCLLSLVLGMAASLGGGALTIVGGLNHYFYLPTTPWSLALVCGLIVVTFCVSAVTGLTQGIKFLSDWNARIFFFIAGFIFIFGPTGHILSSSAEALVEYGATFFKRSLYLGGPKNDPWPRDWSIFYWANWLAWAPITALFLGQIARGYTVRAFLIVNWLIPSIFGIIWMSIFGGSTLHLQISGAADVAGIMKSSGPESAVYTLFESLPLAPWITGLFVGATFLSYVTGADGNTSAMGSMSSTGICDENLEAKPWIKLSWGLVIGVVSWVMVSYAGLDGIRMLSNLGGLPALFLVLVIAVGLVKILVTKEYRSRPPFV